MADKKISEMTAASAYTGANEFYEMVQGGNTRQGSHELLKTYLDTLYAPVVTTASYYANTMAGNGSTATKIPYYTNAPVNSPNSQFTVANSSTNGLSITINVAGIYAFSATFDTGVQYAGFSVNASSLTTNVQSLAVGERLGVAYVNSVGEAMHVAVTRRFAVNDVIRPHTNGAGASTAAVCNFICEKVG